MTATAPAPTTPTVSPAPAAASALTFEDIKALVGKLTLDEREDLRQELAYLDYVNSPEFRQRMTEVNDRIAAGTERLYPLEELERRIAESEAAGK